MGCCKDALSINEDPAKDLRRICPVISCGDGELPADGSTYLYKDSSFKLTYQFMEDVEILDPRTIDFNFYYSILDLPEVFVASHIQGNIVNCFIDDSTKTVIVPFWKPGLDQGKLWVRYEFLLRDNDFVFGPSRTVFSEYTKFKLTEDPSQATRPNGFSFKAPIKDLPFTVLVGLA